MKENVWLGLSLLLASFHAIESRAEETSATALKSGCSSEIAQYCASSAVPGEILKCLADHDSDLSQRCKDDLQRVASAMKQTRDRAGGAMSSFGGANAFSPPVPLVSYEARLLPGEGASALNENKFSLSAPLLRSPSGALGVSLSGSRLHFGEAPVLNTGRVMARNWVRSEIGFQYHRPLPEKKNWGLRTSFGFSSDRVSGRDLSYSVNAHYGYPGAGNGYWVLFAFLSNNSPIGNGIPIPGFMYFYKTRNFTGMFGFPLVSMQWTPASPWTLSFSLFGPILQSEIAFGSIDTYQIFAGFHWNRQLFMPLERVEKKDRFSVEEKKALVGFRTPLFSDVAAEVQAGYSFGRHLSIGDSIFNKDRGKMDLESGMYYSLNIRAGF